MGRDHLKEVFRLAKIVSIHTPTWGVTELIDTYYPEIAVSIHTPTWGVTGA